MLPLVDDLLYSTIRVYVYTFIDVHNIRAEICSDNVIPKDSIYAFELTPVGSLPPTVRPRAIAIDARH